jgi:hypothetical protein
MVLVKSTVFGNRIICTSAALLSKACVLGDVNHLWYCCKLEDLIKIKYGLRVPQISCMKGLLKSSQNVSGHHHTSKYYTSRLIISF